LQQDELAVAEEFLETVELPLGGASAGEDRQLEDDDDSRMSASESEDEVGIVVDSAILGAFRKAC
jgi:hypothetical protein